MSASRPRIRPLPGHLIDLIAAGEVIERPASVVKELVENSLDAGARRIGIEVRGGGFELVRVTDDGHGMLREDLPSALERHCTSKLGAPGDLEAIASLGFRGEALPSIAAVSALVIASRVADEPHGWAVTARNGALEGPPRPLAMAPGTRVEVRDLFAATPARRRFLRSPRSEGLRVVRLVRHLIAARPEVTWTLQVDGGSGLRSDPGRWLAAVGGRALARDGLRFARRDGELAVEGWLAPPEAARSQADAQWVVVNGRAVTNPLLARAVRLACGERVPPGRHPGFVLHVTLPAREVDVNVHPAKLEVRLRDPRRVHDLVYAAVRSVLTPVSPPSDPQPAAAAGAAGRGLAGGMPAMQRAIVAAVAEPDVGRLGRLVAVVAGRHALTRAGERLGLVALAPAAAALMAARLADAGHRPPVVRRTLLVPEPLTLPPALDAREGDWQPQIARHGFVLDRAGPGAFVVREVPAALTRGAMAPAVTALIAHLLAAGCAPRACADVVAAAAVADMDPVAAALDAPRLLEELAAALERGEIAEAAVCRWLDAEVLEALWQQR